MMSSAGLAPFAVASDADPARTHADALKALGLSLDSHRGDDLPVRSPIDGALLATLGTHDAADIDAMVARARTAFLDWRQVPAPHRGELVRRFGTLVRDNLDPLSALLSAENGKILEEARGEVQEVVDICEFAVGLSRQLYGLTIASERPQHRLTEYWHPVGVLGLISAFNFPAAVWAWGTTVALVCGNAGIWKPSEKTPTTALAFVGLLQRAMRDFEAAPANLVQVAIGGADIGARLADHPGIDMLSATGSTRMGRDVAVRTAQRFARSILELGGNNAMIVTPSADLDLAIPAITFAAAGTAGQRCTTLRRLIVHEDRKAELLARLMPVIGKLSTGNPLAEGVQVGPLIDGAAFDRMQAALERARAEGGTVHGGERITDGVPATGYYVRPAIVEMPGQSAIVCEETFAPILYVIIYREFTQAITLQNGVPQGLSSAVFTMDMREAEYFQSALGSDCGIVNVNIGTSGAEIGGAFGGEKQTGGGRVSGSDSWKNYMRRATATVNYSSTLTLAQGVRFDVVEDDNKGGN
ncbi:aldehyde dehydrogenase family protein [Sphingoaurantiacus capsulatus]|uniref:aldehyde dehydrogenase (NAD(+)) n=2 Tax=Sphingoaurantiacus capsulatus TaxID=1771310 RepID=A0ABV7X4D2_9SPHN